MSLDFCDKNHQFNADVGPCPTCTGIPHPTYPDPAREKLLTESINDFSSRFTGTKIKVGDDWVNIMRS